MWRKYYKNNTPIKKNQYKNSSINKKVRKQVFL